MTGQLYKPGDVVAERYRIKAMIGSGGFGRVYRAVEQRLNRDVALKVMMSADDESMQARFEREARLVAELNHPHIVTLYEYSTLSDGRLCLALEYVEGTTLEGILQHRGALPSDRIRDFLVQMLDALAEAHSAGVLHRDLKPTNLMVVERPARPPHVKLLDFGIAKKAAGEDGHVPELTGDHQAVGTRRYMSPEQLRQLPLTPASDLFGVGLLVYEMWSGDSPFESPDPSDIYERMEQFDEELGALADAPPWLRRLGERLLAPDPERRIDSAEEALEHVGHDGGQQASRPARDRRPEVGASSSFPVGLDRRFATSSSELTGTDLSGGSLTREARRQLGTSVSELMEDSPDPADRSGTDPPLEAGEADEPQRSETETSGDTAEVRRGGSPARWLGPAVAFLVASAVGLAIWAWGPSTSADAPSSSDRATSATDDTTPTTRSERDGAVVESIDGAAEQIGRAVRAAKAHSESQRPSGDTETSGGESPSSPNPESTTGGGGTSSESSSETFNVPLEPFE